MLICSIWFSAPSFWMGGGLESRCVGRVFGADGAVRLAYFGRKVQLSGFSAYPEDSLFHFIRIREILLYPANC